jgi:hypothetical protein
MTWLNRKTVPKISYETLQEERDAFEREVQRLQEQNADLTGKYTALAFDEAITRGLALRAIALLQRVDTTRTGGVAFKQEIDVLVGEARSAGVIEEGSSLSADR